MNIKEAAEIIRKGGVVAYPTETAYALGADATNEDAVMRIYELKKRPLEKKVPVIVDSLETIKKFAEIDPLAEYLSRNLHPGPLNLAIETEFPWIGAWRISKSRIARSLAKLVGKPIVATSANISGMPAAFSPEEVKAYFSVPVVGKIKKKRGPVSTIFDTKSRKFIREGAINREKVLAYVTCFEALKRIEPTENERKKVEKVAGEVLKIAKKYHRPVILGGSVAKGTYLKDIRDIDFFFLFRVGEDLEKKIEVLKKVAMELSGKYEISYAQHPYVKTSYKGFEIELVPAYKTKPPEIYSAADRSPWHVKWVKKCSKETKKEAMLIKAFFKGIKAYGAELKVQGFSGYACEVLAKKYRNLVNLLEEIKKWENVPFLPDPVDKNRNVLAAVSDETLQKVKIAAKNFLNKPSLKFFFPNPPPVLPSPFAIENKALIIAKKPEMFEDAIWGMGKRLARKIKKQAEINGYRVVRTKVWIGDKVFIAFELSSTEVEKIIEEGPPLKAKKHVKKFREKHRDAFEMGGRLYAVIKNRYPSFKMLVESIEDKLSIESAYVGREIGRIYNKLGEGDKRELSEFLIGKPPWEY